jgi:hypothetical protein
LYKLYYNNIYDSLTARTSHILFWNCFSVAYFAGLFGLAGVPGLLKGTLVPLLLLLLLVIDSALLVLVNLGLVVFGGGVGASLLEFSSLDLFSSNLFRSIFGTLYGTKLFGGNVALLNLRAGSCGNAVRLTGDRGGGVGGSVNLYKFPLEFPLAKLLLLFEGVTLSVLVSILLVNESSNIVGRGAAFVFARGLDLYIEKCQIRKTFAFISSFGVRIYFNLVFNLSFQSDIIIILTLMSNKKVLLGFDNQFREFFLLLLVKVVHC